MGSEKRKATIRKNKAIGMIGEAIVRGDLIAEEGFPKRTPHGQDFTTVDGIKHEVKTGNAKLSSLQKKTRKKNPKKYKVHRVQI